MPDYARLTPFLKGYMEFMGWDDLNWLEDVHMGYEEGQPAVFDRELVSLSTVKSPVPESTSQAGPLCGAGRGDLRDDYGAR